MKLKTGNQQRKSIKPEADSVKKTNKVDKPLIRLTKKRKEGCLGSSIS